MVSEWEEVTIGDVCFLGDGAHAKVQRTDFGVPYLTSKNIGNGSLKLDSLDHISEMDYERLFPVNSRAVTRLKSGDILTGIIGTFGNLYLYKESDHFGISSAVAIVRPDQTRVWPRYLYYYLTSSYFRQKHASYAAGSVQGYTNLPTIRQLPAIVPPLAEQKAIASILGALDDKIELNRRMNATLEAMARALFQSWFVDFDPVRAKLDGRKPEGMDKATAALFPDAFKESEAGQIPKGWTIRALADVIDVKHGFAFEGKYFSDERCGDILLTPGNFAIGGGFKDAKVKYYIGPVSEDYILCDHDLVLTMTDLSKAADTLGYPAMIPPPPMGYRYLHNQRIGKVHITQSNAATPLFLYRLFCSEAYRHEILAGATGTTVKHTSPTRIRAFKSLFPSAGVLEVFEKQLNIWYLLATQNESQSRTLATLRDTLLPKLLSGELSVASSKVKA